jgi:hypothetical protein
VLSRQLRDSGTPVGSVTVGFGYKIERHR